MTGVTEMKRIGRITVMTRVTGMIGIGDCDGKNKEKNWSDKDNKGDEITNTTRVSGMTEMNRKSRMTGMTGITGVTEMTRVTAMSGILG